MQLLVCCNRLVELVFSYIAPGADCIRDNLNIEFGHVSKRASEHIVCICSKTEWNGMHMNNAKMLGMTSYSNIEPAILIQM